ncbi:nitroreductase family protein [Candidatus Omnitrophota bacterium]
MKLCDAINTRRSVQAYEKGHTITQEEWKQLFDLVTQSPSSWNLQPWKFLVIEDEKKRADIQAMAWGQPKITESSALIIVLGDTNPQRNKVQIFDQWKNNGIINDEIYATWMDAVGAIYPTDYEQHEFAIRNSSFAAMTLMLAAWGMGYATCPMIGFDKKGLSEYIGVDDDWIVSFIMTIGKAAGEVPFERQQRFPFSDIVAFDTL